MKKGVRIYWPGTILIFLGGIIIGAMVAVWVRGSEQSLSEWHWAAIVREKRAEGYYISKIDFRKKAEQECSEPNNCSWARPCTPDDLCSAQSHYIGSNIQQPHQPDDPCWPPNISLDDLIEPEEPCLDYIELPKDMMLIFPVPEKHDDFYLPVIRFPKGTRIYFEENE